MAEIILDGEGEEIRGHRELEGTDLEIAYNIEGDHLMLRVNKGPVLIFRVKLIDALKPLSDDELIAFNSVCPDFGFKIGDTKGRMLALAKGVGLDDAQLAALEAKLA